MTKEQLAIRHTGRQDPKRHLSEKVNRLPILHASSLRKETSGRMMIRFFLPNRALLIPSLGEYPILRNVWVPCWTRWCLVELAV